MNFVPPQGDISDRTTMMIIGKQLKPTSPPFEFFRLFCDDDFFDNIVEESNLFNTQRSTQDYQEAVKKKKKKISANIIQISTTSYYP